MRIGVFGGTFDPPHVGHLILASEAAFQLQLAKVLWVLTPDPPHKLSRPISPVESRLLMVQAIMSDDPFFELSRVDLDRPGPHFAVDTIHRLQEIYPEARLVYLMGGDSLHDLPSWYKPRELVDACAHLGIMHRVGDEINLADLEAQLPGISAKIVFIDAPLMEISSSQIRQRIASGQPYKHFLTRSVYKVIRSTGLYADPEKV
jgi:nicotinate-nucleotide adenylyltransferase